MSIEILAYVIIGLLVVIIILLLMAFGDRTKKGLVLLNAIHSENDLTLKKIEKESAFIDLLLFELNKVIVGQKPMIERLLIGLLGKGHILLEGVPGLAKTLVINSLSQAIKGSFSRIQFTPDLMPSDIIGAEILDESRNFKFLKGPVFSNIVLADEINRAPAKVQSALLEAMQEKQVTIGDKTFKLEPPFLVMATQNPIEQEGTYPLPEAQVDRFMLKVVLDYPKKEEEQMIIRNTVSKEGFPTPNVVIDTKAIIKAREIVKQVYMDEKIEKYIVDIVYATRTPKEYNLEDLEALIEFGGSPRASIALAMASKAYAFIC